MIVQSEIKPGREISGPGKNKSGYTTSITLVIVALIDL